jgi:hypothetical protein
VKIYIMRPSEKLRFEHAFYRVCAVGIMARHRRDQAIAFLDKCSPWEICALEELISWAWFFTGNDFGSLGLDTQDETWKAAGDLVASRWGDVPLLDRPDFTPFNFFAFFDQTQRYLELNADHEPGDSASNYA